MKKKLLVIMLSIVLLTSSISSFAYATEKEAEAIKEIENDKQAKIIEQIESEQKIVDKEIENKIKIDDDFKLYTDEWTLIGDENNLFSKTIIIVNDEINKNDIDIVVRNSKLQPLGSKHDLRPGYYIEVDVPANSGRYTIKAKASKISGIYNIRVYDKKK